MLIPPMIGKSKEICFGYTTWFSRRIAPHRISGKSNTNQYSDPETKMNIWGGHEPLKLGVHFCHFIVGIYAG